MCVCSPVQLAKLETQSARDSETVASLTMELREFTESNASSSREIEKLKAMVWRRDTPTYSDIQLVNIFPVTALGPHTLGVAFYRLCIAD